MTQKEKIKQLEEKVELLEQRLNFLIAQQGQIGAVVETANPNDKAGWFPIASENHGTLGMGNELVDYRPSCYGGIPVGSDLNIVGSTFDCEPFTIGYLKQAANVPEGKSVLIKGNPLFYGN